MSICPSMPRTVWFMAVVPQLLIMSLFTRKHISLGNKASGHVNYQHSSGSSPGFVLSAGREESPASQQLSFPAMFWSLPPSQRGQLVVQSGRNVSFSLAFPCFHQCLLSVTNSQWSHEDSFKYQWALPRWGNVHHTYQPVKLPSLRPHTVRLWTAAVV